MHREGAELAFSYANDKLKPRVEKFAAEFESDIVLPCDVTSDDEIVDMFEQLGARWSSLDALVHSVAFAPREALAGDYLENLDREGFRIAHDISSYSLAAMAKAARPMMQNTNGAIITMSYLGSHMGVAKASLEANVRYLSAALGPEGIRVNSISAGPINSISAGPIKTLAAAGIGNFKKILDEVAHNAPLQCGCIFMLGPGGRDYRGKYLRRLRLQHRQHGRARLAGHREQGKRGRPFTALLTAF
jgi:enoyl-[acyl-carrier protein] reductase I